MPTAPIRSSRRHICRSWRSQILIRRTPARINRTLTGKTDGEQDNAAVYVFDTLKFNEQWWFNAGVRYEKVDGSSTIYVVQQTAANGGLPPRRLTSHRHRDGCKRSG